MMRYWLSLKFQVLTLILLVPVAWTAESEVPQIHPHPVVELEVPVTSDEGWKALDQQPHVSFAATNEAFERHRVPAAIIEANVQRLAPPRAICGACSPIFPE